MTRGLAGLLVAALAGGLAFALVYGTGDGLVTGALLLGSGVPAVLGAHVLAARRGALGGLSRQFAATLGLAVALTLIGAAVVGLAMFVSPHDALVMAVLLLFVAGLIAYSASVVASEVLEDVDSVRRAVRVIGAGERRPEIATGGRDEVAELAEAAERMAAELARREGEREAAEDARRDLVAAVSHDLRTPLTSLRLLTDAISDDVADPETTAGYRRQLSTHVQALSALVDDLFELSRIEAGEIGWSMERVELGELVAESVEAMQPQADHRGVIVAAGPAGLAATARANPERVQRVLFNLIQNAIRHTPADGSVTVKATDAGETVEVEVADTGEGLRLADRERAFEPLYRGHDAARSGEGRGLGLAICRAIVEAHGGRIWFADVARGTSVRFSLPAAE